MRQPAHGEGLFQGKTSIQQPAEQPQLFTWQILDWHEESSQPEFWGEISALW